MRHREIDLSASDVDVPHVGGQAGQEGLDVSPLSVPLHHGVNRERVSKVVDPDIEGVLGGLRNARVSTGPTEGVVNAGLRKETPGPGWEEGALRGRLRLIEVFFEGVGQGRSDGDQTRLEELGIPHGE